MTTAAMIEPTKLDKAIMVAHSLMEFFYYLFPKELTVPMERTDLPEEWRGKQVMSEKQRIMVCDRSRQIAMRPSRKLGKTGENASANSQLLPMVHLARWTRPNRRPFPHAKRAPPDQDSATNREQNQA